MDPGNPFAGKDFYVNPANSIEYDKSISTATGEVKKTLELMQGVASAYWIDNKHKIRGGGTSTVEGILTDAAAKTPVPLVVFIWYDLPNRDCAAHASNGEICCTKGANGRCDYTAGGTCEEGIKEYSTDYVDPFVSVLKQFEDKVPIVVVMEPDSLPNLATNTGMPGCGNTATQNAYKKGMKYALDELTTKVPKVSLYLDASHGGWLGWANSQTKFLRILKSAGLPMTKLRGFSLNVANYQPLGIQCPWGHVQGIRNGWCMMHRHPDDPCCADPCKLNSQWNPANNEMNFAAGLTFAAKKYLGMDAHVIIDTGRNGVTDMRQSCSSWCNIRGAGVGVRSTAKTANTSLVDAYYWLKTPGESDGCTQKLPSGDECPRFDDKCKSPDSIGGQPSEPRAPEAGRWFDWQVKQLAKKANFAPPPPPQPAPPAPAPGPGPNTPAPTPWTPPAPTPPLPPTGKLCCWGAPGAKCEDASMSCQPNPWCGASLERCSGCGGTYCKPKDAMPAVGPSLVV